MTGGGGGLTGGVQDGEGGEVAEDGATWRSP